MTPRLHPSEAILASYASGALADGAGLVCAAHLERCGHCRQTVDAMEAAGGALLDDLPGAPLSADALGLALARIERPAPASARPAPPAERRAFASRLPQALRGRRIGARRFVGPGLWVAHVASNAPDGWRTYLLQAAPGLRLLHHDHRGEELALVLTGAFRDAAGVYRAGDFVETGEGQPHRPEIEGGEPCLCLVAGKGGIKAQGLDRLLQSFLQV